MQLATRRHAMTREEFLSWAENQELRYEFDGFAPVAMTGGTNNHGLISGNIYFALRSCLGTSPCRPMTPESGGVATIGTKVRYPDATVTCSPITGADRLIPDPVVLFEVASATSARDDHVDKRIEYQTIASVLRYVVVEQSRKELRVFQRGADGTWLDYLLGEHDRLEMPEIGVVLTVAEIFTRA